MFSLIPLRCFGLLLEVEKPLALGLDECRLLSEKAARRDRLKVLVGFNLRRHRLVRAARETIRRGELGEVTLVRTVFTSGIRRALDYPQWRRRRDGRRRAVRVGRASFRPAPFSAVRRSGRGLRIEPRVERDCFASPSGVRESFRRSCCPRCCSGHSWRTRPAFSTNVSGRRIRPPVALRFRSLRFRSSGARRTVSGDSCRVRPCVRRSDGAGRRSRPPPIA
jgi:hypothetical protein